MSPSFRSSLRALFILTGLSLPALGCSSAFVVSSGPGGDDASDENPGIMGPSLDGAKDDAAEAGASTHHDAQGETDASGDAASGSNDEATIEGGEPAESSAEAATEASASESGATCAPPNLQCTAGCVPSDVHNCGACGHDCTDLAHVSGPVTCTASGACSFPQSSCAPGWAACGSNPDTGCETDLSQAATCGSCTTACTSSAPVCSGSGGTYGCTTGCEAPTSSLCSGTCVDETSNPSHCGGCTNSCSGVTYGQPACSNSTCGFTCNSGYTGCPTAAPTACVDEQDDPRNCGACAHVCPPSTNGGGQPSCTAATCGLTCNSGLTACPVVDPTECDNTTNDLQDCGSCGNVCSTTVAHASPTCQNSQCGFVCQQGYLLCNGDSCIGPDPNGIFVSPGGSGTDCTSSAPCATIAAALSAATQTGKSSIYLDQGTYTELVSLGATSGAIHGGWTYSPGAGTWTNCNGTESTSVISAPAGTNVAVEASAGGTWTLDTVTIEDGSTAAAGESIYGVVAGGAFTLSNVSITVAGGGGGAAGGTGAAATPATGTCAAASTAGGANGTPGITGLAGNQGTYASTGFLPAQAGAGSGTPTAGNNGTPGGAAGQATTYTCNGEDSCSETGSTVSSGAGLSGCGGGPGGPGSGGWGGGASIGVFVGQTGTVTFDGVSIATGPGGPGGSGGAGGGGGSGSQGSAGSSASYYTGCGFAASQPPTCAEGGECKCTLGTQHTLAGGTAGGQGGTGGAGGQGGGGAGGDSLCYAITGGGSVSGSPSCTPGAGGQGGNQGVAGTGQTGRSGMHN